MPRTKPKHHYKGFTIIEVLIVLAIAGLIMLIVFLAIPALMRSNRNSGRSRDALFIAAARMDYNTNVGVSFTPPPGGYLCDPPITSKTFCKFIKDGLTYYDLANVHFYGNQKTLPTEPMGPATVNDEGFTVVADTEKIQTITYYICNPDGSGATTTGAVPNNMVVLYALEGASGPITRCADSNTHASVVMHSP